MSLNADRLINRATVVGCAISATRNSLKLHSAENIKSPLVQHSCRNAKVVEAFCHAGWPPPTRCRPQRRHAIPIEPCCTAGCRTHRDFVPWRFSAAGRHARVDAAVHPGVRKPAQERSSPSRGSASGALPTGYHNSTVSNGLADQGRKRLSVNLVFRPGATSTRT